MSEAHTLDHSSIRDRREREREKSIEYMLFSLELEMACKYAIYEDAHILSISIAYSHTWIRLQQ